MKETEGISSVEQSRSRQLKVTTANELWSNDKRLLICYILAQDIWRGVTFQGQSYAIV